MIYVLSDIHGSRRRFDSVMEQIGLRADDTLYVLGDVIDRHPDGIAILQELRAMPNVRLLPGNHEYMMLQALDRPYAAHSILARYAYRDAIRRWYRNGGEVTHASVRRMTPDARQELFRFLRQLPAQISLEAGGTRFRLVHAAPRELYSVYRDGFTSEQEFQVWYRMRPDEALPGSMTVVFGHTPTMYFQKGQTLRIWRSGRMIGIDCGSGFPDTPVRQLPYQGRLACLRLDDMAEFYSKEQADPDG